MNNTKNLSNSNQLEQLDRLSAFLDGELSESEFDSVLDCLDDEHCAELKRYQLISDVMRDSSLAISTTDLFSVRLAKALDAEPAHSIESADWSEPLPATGTYGASAAPLSSGLQSARIHENPSKSKTRLAFVAGGVAAAFATIMTYNIFQSSEIQTAADISAPVLASSEITVDATPTPAPVQPSAPLVVVTNNAPTPSTARSFSHTPTMALNATASNSRGATTEERRRTYPEYLRSHSDMSAQTPFMQVNYQSIGSGQ
ncbi:MAG: RseA family anti-sigma factor [Alcaligenaceae bacterium]|nr:RseA family anti-sigma factor [Alcaligenaceae bacterium]